MRLFLSIVLGAGCVCAQSGIEVPTIGVIVDSSGSLRQVQGVAGSFFLDPPSVPGVLSAACSEQLCLVKTDSQVISTTGTTDAPPGPAIFGFSGDSAAMFFPQARTFARWHDNTLDPLDWAVDGEILSVRSTEIAVRKDGTVSIVYPGSMADDSVVDSIADATGPVLLLPKGVVFATGDEIVLRQDHSEVRFELAGAESITAMGPHYVAIRAGGAIYAVRIDAGRESLFLLPGMTP